MLVVRKLSVLFKEKLGIGNVQIINSSGAEAQQNVFHIHFHIVPRKNGDGHTIKWATHPAWISEFNILLKELR